MKRNIVGTVFFATFMLGLAAVAPAQDGPSCSNASLAGAWGYTETGTVIAPTGPVPAAAVGRYTFDRAGAFSGTQYSSTGGTIKRGHEAGDVYRGSRLHGHADCVDYETALMFPIDLTEGPTQ